MKERCIYQVHESGRMVNFHRCLRYALDGSQFCRIHSPAYIEAKRAQRDKVFNERMKNTARRIERLPKAIALLTRAHRVLPPRHKLTADIERYLKSDV